MVKKFENVKAIKFVAKFEGSGCVNYDGKEQSFFLSKNKLFSSRYNNNMFAKKTFKKDGDDVKFKYKISSECIRHEIFKETMPFMNPTIIGVPHILYSSIANPDFLLRGYMFTQQNNNTIKRKSPFTITDLIEDGECWRDSLQMELHTRSGEKNSDIDEGDTTLYNVENVGLLNYTSKGFIDLTELQFIPDDVAYDRVSLNIEDGSAEEKIYFQALKNNMINLTPEFNYYYSEGSYAQDEWAERGVILNKESVDMMVKRILKNILKVNILRRNAYLSNNGLDIEIITNEGVLREKITLENVDDFIFEYEDFYIKASEEKIEKNKKILEIYKENEKINEKEKKEERNKKKEEKKIKKEAEKKKKEVEEKNINSEMVE